MKASEHEKAMNPDVWPERVGVSYYKAPSRRPGQDEAGGQGGEGGGLQDRSQGAGQDASRGRSRQGFNRRNKFVEEVDEWNVPRNSRSNSQFTVPAGIEEHEPASLMPGLEGCKTAPRIL